MISIGQMAQAGNCKVQTVRYYEQIGLLPIPARSRGNQRLYQQIHVERIRFIRHSRELGFSLEKIREILSLSDNPDRSCAEIDRITREHLQEVESRIARLQSLHGELQRMLAQCSNDKVADCKIIEALSDHELCLSEH